MVWSLKGWTVARALSLDLILSGMRVPAFESLNHQGAGAKRRLAGEAVWRDGVGGLWRRKGWETSGSQTPTKTGIVRWADGLTGLGRNGPLARTEE